MRTNELRLDVGTAGTVELDSVAKSSRSIADFLDPFHWEDVPPEIVRADVGGGYPLRSTLVPPFGSTAHGAYAQFCHYPRVAVEPHRTLGPRYRSSESLEGGRS